MAFMDKLKFWKKKEEPFAELDKQLGTIGRMPETPGAQPEQQPLGLETGYGEPMTDQLSRSADAGLDFGKPAQETGFPSFSMEPPVEEKRPAYPAKYEYEQQTAAAPIQTQSTQQQLELVSAKLDTIRVSLESINHRLAALERVLHVPEYEEVQQPRRRRGVW